MAELVIQNFGPIRRCKIEEKRFMILTGAQASGKSTIAKVIFFFRTVAEDVIQQIRTKNNGNTYHTGLENDLKKRLRNKFLRMFGSSWPMRRDMKLRYEYSRWTTIEVFLEPDRHNPSLNYVNFQFDRDVLDLISKYQNYEDIEWDESSLTKLREDVNALFSDGYETVYVPAGRSMVTLLTDQLLNIFSEEDNRTFDFCTEAYVRRIFPLRAQIGSGLQNLLKDALYTSQVKINRKALEHLEHLMNEVLHGYYAYVGGEERIVLSTKKYVKINFSSSGQQEAVWIFNLLYFYILRNKKIFLIMEEPEAHLYPTSQKHMAEALGVFAGGGNAVLVTTHSPYILGQFNNMLYAGDLRERVDSVLKERLYGILSPLAYLDPSTTCACFLSGGNLNNAMEDGLVCNEIIDEASVDINEVMENLLEVEWDLNTLEEEDARKIHQPV